MKLWRWYKILLIVAASLVLIFLLFWGLLHLTSFQNLLSQKLVTKISNDIEAQVKIGKVDIDPFKSFVWSDILIEDQSKDTLLFIQTLELGINFFSIFKKEASINEIFTQNTSIYLNSLSDTTSANYQFISNYLSPEKTGNSKKSPWKINLNTIELENTTLVFNDKEMNLKVSIPSLKTAIKKLDLSSEQIHFNTVSILDADLNISYSTNGNTKTTSSDTLVFPVSGWDILADKIVLTGENIHFQNQTDDWKLLTSKISLEDLIWNENLISCDVKQMETQLNSELMLEHLTGQIQISPNAITADNLSLKTFNSTLQSHGFIDYLAFDDLNHFAEKVNAELDVSQCQIDLAELQLITGGKWKDQFRKESKISIEGRLQKKKDQLIIDNSYWNMGDMLSWQLNGSIRDLDQQMAFHLIIEDLTTSYLQLTQLLPGISIPAQLSEIGEMKLSTRLRGSPEIFLFKDLVFNGSRSNHLEADIEWLQAGKNSSQQIKANIEKLVLDPGLIQGFFPDTTFRAAEKLGELHYVGSLNRSLNELDVKGIVSCNPGQFDMDILMAFDEKNQIAAYSTTFDFQSFDFSSLTNNLMGPASAHLEVKGKGVEMDDLNMHWELDASKLTANNYEYNNALFSGSISGNQLKNTGTLKDEHADVDFVFDVILDDSLSSSKLILQAGHLDLHTLQLYSTPLYFSGSVASELYGTSWNNLEGNLSIGNFTIANASNSVQSDELLLTSERNSDGEQKLALQSEFLQVLLEGKYNLRNLPGVTLDFIHQYFPIENKSEELSIEKTQNINDTQDFKFQLSTADLSTLTSIFQAKLTEFRPIYISGSFRPDQHHIQVDVRLNGITYGAMKMDSVEWIVSSNIDSILHEFSARNFYNGSLHFPIAEMHAGLANKSLNFNLELQGPLSIQNISFGNTVQYNNGSYISVLDPIFLFNNNKWNIHPENFIRIKDNIIEISQLQLSDTQQMISLNTIDTSEIDGQPPLKILVKDYKLGDMSSVFMPEQMHLNGIVNGDFEIFNLSTRPYFKGLLEIDRLSINNNEMGNFRLFTENDAGNRKLLHLDASLQGNSNQVLLNGNYSLENSEIMGSLIIDKLDVNLIEIFSQGELNNTTGTIYGPLKLSGNIDKPVLDGELSIRDMLTCLTSTASCYRLDSMHTVFNENRIDMGVFELKDESGHISRGTGNIIHQYFKDIQLNFNIESDEFEVMNRAEAGDDPYYGQLKLRSNVNIAGPLDRLKIDVSASTLPGTSLVFEANTNEGGFKQDDFIIFKHPDKNYELSEKEEKLRISTPYNFDLNANIGLTEDAELIILFDPESGDELLCRGNANLAVQLDAEGNLKLSGDFVFKEGTYLFNYEGLVKKEFEIQDGSSLIFPGKTEDIRFNMSSLYRTKTSVLPLIQNQTSLTDDERKEANKPVEIHILLSIKGTLQDPQLSFQIAAPKEEEGKIGNAISRRLTQLNENPDELNRQVFGILFFNSFFAENDFAAAESISQSVADAAFSSLRGMVTSQLNSLAAKYVKGVELSFDMDTYRSRVLDNTEGAVTELGVSVSKQLFNDRLSVKVGSNVNFSRENTISWSNADFASVAGDFVLEYKLNKKGNYLLRVFHLNDYDIIEDENDYKTGVGFVIRKHLKDKSDKKAKK